MSGESQIKTLYVFRHGETDWNKEYRFQGRIDIPLNETGRKQALTLKTFFDTHPVEAVLCSDLGRADETAKIALGHRGVPFIVEPRIRETNLGDIEGLTHEEILVKFGHEVLENWRSVEAATEHSRFPNGESKAEHRDRILAGLRDFLSRTNYTRIAVSTHGGVLRRLIHFIKPHLSQAAMINNCVLYEVRYDPRSETWDLDIEPKSSVPVE